MELYGKSACKSRINKLYGDWQRHGLHYRARIFGSVSGSRHQCPTLFLCCLSVQVNIHQCFVYCTEHQDGEHLLDLTSMKTVVVLIVPAEVDDVLFLFFLSKVKVSVGLYLMLRSFTNQLLAQPDMSKCRKESTASMNDVNFLPKLLDAKVIYGLLQASIVRVLL